MKRVRLLAILPLAVLPLLGVTPSARADVGQVAAAVLGGVNTDAGACTQTPDHSLHLLESALVGPITEGPGTGVEFVDATITGLFAEGGNTFLGSVTTPAIPACTHAIHIGGESTQVLNHGELGGGTFGGSAGGNCLEGAVNGGSFTTLGVVAIVRLDIEYDVDPGAGCASDDGDTTSLLGLIEVVPAETVACAVDEEVFPTGLCAIFQADSEDPLADAVVGEILSI